VTEHVKLSTVVGHAPTAETADALATRVIDKYPSVHLSRTHWHWHCRCPRLHPVCYTAHIPRSTIQRPAHTSEQRPCPSLNGRPCLTLVPDVSGREPYARYSHVPVLALANAMRSGSYHCVITAPPGEVVRDRHNSCKSAHFHVWFSFLFPHLVLSLVRSSKRCHGH
jgi:hypothetical protein